jgi:hypothetical protein
LFSSGSRNGVPSVPIRAVVPVGAGGMAAERSHLERLPLKVVVGQAGIASRGDRYNGRCPTHVSAMEERLSVLIEIGSVAHAVTKTLAIPILLETAARASPNFVKGWGGKLVAQASLTDRSKDEEPGSCRSSSMQRAGYVAGECLGRGGIGLWEK